MNRAEGRKIDGKEGLTTRIGQEQQLQHEGIGTSLTRKYRIWE